MMDHSFQKIWMNVVIVTARLQKEEFTLKQIADPPKIMYWADKNSWKTVTKGKYIVKN